LANAGIGSASHLCGMLLMSQLQVTLTTVPYRGTRPGDERSPRQAGRHDLRPGHQHDRPDPEQAGEGLRHHHEIAPAFAALHLDRKLERMLTMLLRLKDLRRTTVEG
jgi:hypothetical protein